ncbi:hypothetical protein NMY22_g1706 [Coprinellus aureogranulatus]|nr:hypothetical protein NMY22_g1706 [Coprinellus aureogranulatus]
MPSALQPFPFEHCPLEPENRHLKECHEELRRQNEKLKGQVYVLKELNNRLDSRFAESEAEQRRLEAENRRLQEQISQLYMKIEDLKSDRRDLHESNNNLMLRFRQAWAELHEKPYVQRIQAAQMLNGPRACPSLTNEQRKALLKLKEPDRFGKWLSLVVQPNPRDCLDQVSIWEAYRATFPDHTFEFDGVIVRATDIQQVGDIRAAVHFRGVGWRGA